MNSAPIWSDKNGGLSSHVVRAAIHVVYLLDQEGSRTVDARESYWHHATGGLFSPTDLQLGERLLIDCRVVLEVEDSLHITESARELLDGSAEDLEAFIYVRALSSLDGRAVLPMIAPGTMLENISLVIPDAKRREEALLALSRRFDDAHRRLIGEIGEELVVNAARHELKSLGYPELARAVRHVSLQSDQLGYDISAPRIFGAPRLLEVKATAKASTEALTVYLSRNEIEVGMTFPDWALVVCRVDEVEVRSGRILGWCGIDQLKDLLPKDSYNGRWEQAALTLHEGLLIPDLPRPG